MYPYIHIYKHNHLSSSHFRSRPSPMAKLTFTLTLTLLSLLFAFALARTPSGENDAVEFLDLSNSRAESDAKPTLLLPSERPIFESDKKSFLIDNGGLNIAGETVAEEREKAVEAENEGEEEDQRRNGDEVAGEEDQKPVDDEKDEVVEAEQEDLRRPVAVGRLWPEHEHGHFRRPCHHWMKRLMRMRAMRHHSHQMEGRHMPYGDEMGEFRGHERREAEEEEQKPLEVENAAEEDQKKATEPETQILDLSGPMTIVRFPQVNRHFHSGCRHHWLKHMMRMRHHLHGREMPYGRDMILGGGEGKAFDREFFHDVERKEADPEMGEFHDGERKEIDMRTFPTDEGEVREMRPQWMGYHHHHYHHHDDHEGRPWFPFFGRHHHHHDHHHDHEGRPWFPSSYVNHHHDHERFSRQSSGRPFFRREEGEEEEREEGGFLDRIRNFFTNHF